CRSFSDLFVFSDTFIYPPVDFSHITGCEIRLVEEQRSPYDSYDQRNPQSLITSSYLLVIPDSTLAVNSTSISSLLSTFVNQLEKSHSDAFLFPIYSSEEVVSEVTCRHFAFDVK